jgi:hypothetical protein
VAGSRGLNKCEGAGCEDHGVTLGPRDSLFDATVTPWTIPTRLGSSQQQSGSTLPAVSESSRKRKRAGGDDSDSDSDGDDDDDDEDEDYVPDTGHHLTASKYVQQVIVYIFRNGCQK